jgi:hypothetical protein
MIVYDFVEVGTCCFDTLIEKANDNTIGLSIEHLKTYQDKLPNKPNVVKVNAALVADEDLLSKRLQLLGYKLVITQFDTLAKKR